MNEATIRAQLAQLEDGETASVGGYLVEFQRHNANSWVIWPMWSSEVPYVGSIEEVAIELVRRTTK